MDNARRRGAVLHSDHYFQKFSVNGKEFIKYQNQFLERVEKYYEQRNNK